MKKTFDDKIHSTVEEQDKALERRFENIDSLLLKSTLQQNETSAPKALVIRDTFSMPKSDHALIMEIVGKALRSGHVATKSEVIRAGLHVLIRLETSELINIFNGLEKLVPGRKS